MPNTIHNLDTKWFKNDSGEFPAIVMGLDIRDEAAVEEFLDHAIKQFLNQRMCSPPQTANMGITIAGELTAARFCHLWIRRYSEDTILRHFMSLMLFADVLHIRGHEVLDSASLVNPPPEA